LSAIALIFTLTTGILHAMEITAPKNPSPQESEFLDAISKAIQKTNIEGLVALDYLKGGESAKGFMRQFYKEVVGKGCISLELTRVDPTTATKREENGEVLVENLPVRWLLTLIHPSTRRETASRTVLRAGLLNGKIRITNTKSAGEKDQK